jgi:hypothetical protein
MKRYPMTDSKGRPICDAEIDGTGVDRFFVKAYYDEPGFPEVPEDELDYLTDTYPEYCQGEWR